MNVNVFRSSKVILCLGIVPLVSGCSALLHGGSSGTPEYIESLSAERSGIDEEVSRNSRAYHHYLVGQLALLGEDLPLAKQHLSEASSLTNGGSSALHGNLAELHIRSGELLLALEECEKALQISPRDESLRLLKAGILEALNRLKDAEAIYKVLIKEDSSKVDYYLLLGSLYLKEKRFKDAVKVLQKGHALPGRKDVPSYYLAGAYEAQGDNMLALKYFMEAYEGGVLFRDAARSSLRLLIQGKQFTKARDFAERVVREHPDYPMARKVLSELLVGENRIDEALGHLEVLSEGPNSAHARFRIALLELERENFTRALRELLVLLADNPEHHEGRYTLASVYVSLGRNSEAVEELLLIPVESPLGVRARSFAGTVLRGEGKMKEAVEVLEEALKVDPSNTRLQVQLIYALKESSDYSKARSFLNEALQREEKNPDLLFQYGVLLFELDDVDHGIEQLEKVLEIQPDHGDALNFIAYSLAERGLELERAEGYIQRALKLRPQDGYFLDTLGWVYYQQEKYDESVETLKEAARLATGDVVILEHLGNALEKSGDVDEALRVFRSAVELPEINESDDSKKARTRIEKKIRNLSNK